MAPRSPLTRPLRSLQITSSPPDSPSQTSNAETDADEDITSTSPTLPPQLPPPPTEEQRTAALQRELQLLKSMNNTLTNLHRTLATSKANLNTLQTTVSSSTILLDTWTRILSQAEHNARLISDSTWEGSSEDAVLFEKEELERKNRAEREREERERREREKVLIAAPGAEKAGPQAGSRGGSLRGSRGSVAGRRGSFGIGRRGSVRGRGRV